MLIKLEKYKEHLQSDLALIASALDPEIPHNSKTILEQKPKLESMIGYKDASPTEMNMMKSTRTTIYA